MNVYQVGGSIRDELLGLPVFDRDWVVVGSTPEQMIAAGFRPVGRDFPVFLHPDTHEEYALARTERKTGRGYHGFVFHASADVTLEDDLRRRDLTINAIARGADGTLVDPHQGRRDLDARLLRHVSASFGEDPVRILRVARLAARFSVPPTEFAVAPETMELMRRMTASGEADALVPERVWQEMARGLMEHRPSRMLRVLFDCGAMARILPAVRDDAQIMQALDRSGELSLPGRFAIWMQAADDLPATVARLKVPSDCADAAQLLAALRPRIEAPIVAEPVVDALERADAFRRPDRFHMLLQAADVLVPDDARTDRWNLALNAAIAVDAGAIAQRHAGQVEAIKRALHGARVDAVHARLH